MPSPTKISPTDEMWDDERIAAFLDVSRVTVRRLADGHDMFSVSRWLGHRSIALTDAVSAHVAREPN